jgi:hypothetical protein
VFTTAGWHAGDPGSILGMDGLYTFKCITQRFEYASEYIWRYTKVLIYLFQTSLPLRTTPSLKHAHGDRLYLPGRRQNSSERRDSRRRKEEVR